MDADGKASGKTFWKKATSIILWLFCCFLVHAQMPFVIRGKVTDSSGKGLSRATVSVSSNKDSMVVLAGGDGSFILSTFFERTFLLRVTMKGYVAYSGRFDIQRGQRTVELPPLVLQPLYQELESMVVEQVIPLTIRGDTLQFHAAAYKMRKVAILKDL